MTFARRASVFFSIFIVQMVLDQWTKQVATAVLKGQPVRVYLGDLFRLQFATNEGAFLSLGASLPPGGRYWVLTIGVGLLLLGLTVYALGSLKLDATQVGGYAFIASGGFSNWIDRARFDGSVVDFMNMGVGSLRTGVFNIADLAIIVGIAILFIHSWKHEKKMKAAAAASRSSTPAR